MMADDEFDLETNTPNSEDLVDYFDRARDALGLSLELEERKKGKKVAIIRTSDRITYRRCRRKWNWADSRRGNLQSNTSSAPLWLGSGLHFAFEDFHGYRKFERPRDALGAYLQATEQAGIALPPDIDELMHLGKGMMDYYEQWLDIRDPLKTLVINGEPQVEVNFFIEIPKEHLAPYMRNPDILDQYDQVLYSMTIDRVIIDEYKRLWNVEYKSAKLFQWLHLPTDPQVTAYAWGSSVKYPGYEIAGTVYQQHKKQLLQPPAFLASTKMYSTSKRQKTSFALYSGALRNLYGNEESRWPAPNRLYLEYLKTQESDTADSLIRRDYVERNNNQLQAEYQKALYEISEMLDPSTPLYPNPTRDCSWDCPFNVPCVGIDSGEDYLHELSMTTMRRDAPETHWRQHLITP